MKTDFLRAGYRRRHLQSCYQRVINLTLTSATDGADAEQRRGPTADNGGVPETATSPSFPPPPPPPAAAAASLSVAPATRTTITQRTFKLIVPYSKNISWNYQRAQLGRVYSRICSHYETRNELQFQMLADNNAALVFRNTPSVGARFSAQIKKPRETNERQRQQTTMNEQQ